MKNKTKHFTHKDKGGLYAICFFCDGAGELKGRKLVVYSNVNCDYFVRTVEDFNEKMKVIEL